MGTRRYTINTATAGIVTLDTQGLLTHELTFYNTLPLSSHWVQQELHGYILGLVLLLDCLSGRGRHCLDTPGP